MSFRRIKALIPSLDKGVSILKTKDVTKSATK